MSARPEHVKCENCIFWERYEDKDGDYGICSRYPPSLAETPQRLIEGIARLYSAYAGIELDDDAVQEFLEPGYIKEYAHHPQTENCQWCGEFRADWA